MLAAEPVRAIMQRARDADARSLVRAASNVSGLAAILAVVFLAYSRILSQWFLSDDFWYLRASQTASFGFILDSFDYTARAPVNPVMYRPLHSVAFLFTYKLFGLSAWQYHLFSIGVHMVNTVLVWLVARKLAGRASVAYLAAFLFGVHPAYAPAVAWITNNASVFALAFSLGSVLLFLHFLDGGPRRWLYYGASILGIIIAMLIHPESLAGLAVMVLAYLSRHVASLHDLRSPRRFAPVLPYLIAGVALLAILQYVRAHEFYQTQAYSLGGHMGPNLSTYAGQLGNPFGANDSSWHDWRSLVPMLGVLFSGLWLLAAAKSFDLRTRLLVIVWVVLAVLPLTTFTVGVQSRKLYVAGAPFALMMAMVAVAGWDRLAPRFGPFNLRAVDWRYAALAAPVAAGLLLVAVALPLRTAQVTDEKHLADSSLLYLDSQTYKAMIDTIRQTYPDPLPEGARLDLAGVPWPLRLMIHGELDSRMVDAIQIYYGEIEVIGVARVDELPPPNSLGRYLVGFTCPPVCQPPPPQWLIASIWEAQHPGENLPPELGP